MTLSPRERSYILIEAYKEFLLSVKGLALNTITVYENALESFVEFQNNIIDVTDSDIESYIEFMSKKGLQASTQNHHLSTLKMFYSFLIQKKIIEENPLNLIDLPKKIKRLPKAISEDEMKRLLQSCEGNESEDIRLRAMFYLLYATGIRVSELANLKISDIQDAENDGFIRVLGKGSKFRIVPIGETAKKYVKDYIQKARFEFNPKGGEYLFPSPKYKNKPLTRQRVFQLLKEVSEPLGIYISPHGVRHSFATHLLENDANLRTVQKMLGHADLTTTEIYTSIADKQKQKVLEEKHPLSLLFEDE
ncbi:MAG: Tyrosine recombinase XerD [Proteobacteria bacterium]|nr:MAG: Tyrosine recombinase XerD [Pseudomonadota bacterium]